METLKYEVRIYRCALTDELDWSVVDQSQYLDTFESAADWAFTHTKSGQRAKIEAHIIREDVLTNGWIPWRAMVAEYVRNSSEWLRFL